MERPKTSLQPVGLRAQSGPVPVPHGHPLPRPSLSSPLPSATHNNGVAGRRPVRPRAIAPPGRMKLRISNSIGALSPPHPLPFPPCSPRSSSQSRPDQSPWKKGKLLGRGTFGQFYIGFNSESAQMAAIKEVKVISDDSNSRECLMQTKPGNNFAKSAITSKHRTVLWQRTDNPKSMKEHHLTVAWISGAGNLLNAILDPIMIFLLGLGIGGIAISTAISEYVMAFILLWKLNEKVVLVSPNTIGRGVTCYLKSDKHV